MLDPWAIAAIGLLVLACPFSMCVALDSWLPNRHERARIRAARAERMLREETDTEMGER